MNWDFGFVEGRGSIPWSPSLRTVKIHAIKIFNAHSMVHVCAVHLLSPLSHTSPPSSSLYLACILPLTMCVCFQCSFYGTYMYCTSLLSPPSSSLCLACILPLTVCFLLKLTLWYMYVLYILPFPTLWCLSHILFIVPHVLCAINCVCVCVFNATMHVFPNSLIPLPILPVVPLPCSCLVCARVCNLY